MVCLHTSVGKDPALPGSWITGGSGPLKRGHGTTKSPSGDTSALAILQPVLHPEPPDRRQQSSRRRCSSASLLGLQVPMEAPWAAWHGRGGQNALGPVHRQWCGEEGDCPGLAASLLGNSFSWLLTLPIWVREGNCHVVELVVILVRDSANQGSWKTDFCFWLFPIKLFFWSLLSKVELRRQVPQ